jgi:large subunit ribosomal protein L21
MYAIIEIAGQQFKVEKDQKILVQRLEQKEGSQFDIESVLLLDNDKNVLVGEPLISGAKIIARVISHTKGDKVRIFKKKKRKGYQIQTGHRQQFSEIMIEEIIENAEDTRAAGAKKGKPAVKETQPVSQAEEKEAVTEVPVSEPHAKTSPVKKAAARKDQDAAIEETKPVTKKAVTKKPAPKASEAKTAAGKSAGKQTAAEQKDDKKKAPVKKTEAKKPGTKKSTKK